MISLDEAVYEVGDRTSSVRIEAEQVRLARLVAPSRSGDWVSAIRRTAILMGDYVAGVRCFVLNRFASESGAVAC
jgi:hypothetical protein